MTRLKGVITPPGIFGKGKKSIELETVLIYLPNFLSCNVMIAATFGLGFHHLDLQSKRGGSSFGCIKLLHSQLGRY
jgi:hypothetical protein